MALIGVKFDITDHRDAETLRNTTDRMVRAEEILRECNIEVYGTIPYSLDGYGKWKTHGKGDVQDCIRAYNLFNRGFFNIDKIVVRNEEEAIYVKYATYEKFEAEVDPEIDRMR